MLLNLRSSDIVFANIESCLHVLTTEPKELEKTYSYVKKNYGITAINRNTSILSVNVDLIIDVENFDLPISKNGNLAIAIGIEWGFTKLEEIQRIIQSPEFKEHPELFTSTTLVRAKLEEIRILLKMEYWADERFKKLLTSSIVAKANSMISKLPLLFRLAEVNNIDGFLTSSFLLLSPSQNYALIEYLKDNDLPLIVYNNLNPIFGKALGLLKKKYNIDIKELIKKYPYDESEFNKKNGGILR